MLRTGHVVQDTDIGPMPLIHGGVLARTPAIPATYSPKVHPSCVESLAVAQLNVRSPASSIG